MNNNDSNCGLLNQTFTRLRGNVDSNEDEHFQEEGSFLVFAPPKTALVFHECHVTYIIQEGDTYIFGVTFMLLQFFETLLKCPLV